MSDKIIIKLTISIIAICLIPTSVVAGGVAQDYVIALQGKWRGGGIVETDKKAKKVKLRCSSKNTLDVISRTLSMKGRCASSIGSKPMVGHLQYSEDGKTFESVSLTIAGKGGESEVSLQDRQLTLSNTEELKSGELRNTRNIISGEDGQYSIDLRRELDGEYVSRGVLTLKLRPSK
jgi:hypothetical protein